MTPAEVVTEAINNKNFDTALIKSDFILAAELDDIKPVLGDDFYDAVAASPATYATLVTYIKKALAFFTIVKALPFIHSQINTTGVVVNSSEWGAAATDGQRADMMTAAQRMGEVHLEELRRYLTNNNTNTLYALWSGNTRKKFTGFILY